ncbi:MAG: MFS transporter [Chloroflexota bacterium]|nr:MFS transporter [Chloroflexota bacterium]
MKDGSLRQAALLGAVLLLVLLPSNVPAGVVPLLQQEWSTSAALMGAVVGAYQLGYAVAVLVVLPLTDRFSARRVVLASVVITLAASLAFALLARDPVTAIVLRVIAGAGLAGAYMPGVRIVAAAADPARRGRAVGLYVSAFYLGSSLSLLFTGILLGPVGWRGAALALASATALALVVTLATPIATARPAGRARLDPSVVREPRLLGAVVAYAGHTWELYAARGWLAAFFAVVLAARTGSPLEASAVGSQWAAGMLALGVLGVSLGGLVSDRAGRHASAAVFALASGVLSIVLGTLGAAPWPVVVAVGCLLGLLISADSAIYSTLVTETVPAERLGSAQAIQASIGFLAASAAPAAAGLATDVGLGWPGVFATAGAASILAAVVMAAQIPGRSRPFRRARSSAST